MNMRWGVIPFRLDFEDDPEKNIDRTFRCRPPARQPPAASLTRIVPCVEPACSGPHMQPPTSLRACRCVHPQPPHLPFAVECIQKCRHLCTSARMLARLLPWMIA